MPQLSRVQWGQAALSLLVLGRAGGPLDEAELQQQAEELLEEHFQAGSHALPGCAAAWLLCLSLHAGLHGTKKQIQADCDQRGGGQRCWHSSQLRAARVVDVWDIKVW